MCTALPFGFAAAPIVFSKVMREIVKYMRSMWIRLLPFMDDFLFLHESLEGALKLVDIVIDIFSKAGALINFEKSNLKPS